uniref:cytochrome P450 2C42-like isoform X2 n=1 Tax=Doryrhamphus excisus TaxID=161450 RepID=UPI0025ADE0BB|nr:cytochrome P450 2C42-like isoform X2 [Doryrhamphus excisus]
MECTAAVLLLGLLWALLWLLYDKKSNKRMRRLPPGPLAFPLLGNLPQMDKHAPFKSLLKLSETYGPVMTVHLGWQRAVVLVGYEAVKEALVDQADDFTGRMQLPFLHKATRGYDTPFDPTFLLSCSVSNVVCCLVFGQRFNHDDDDFLQLLAIIREMIKFASSPLGQMYNIFPWLTERLPGHQRKVFAHIETVRSFIKFKIQQHEDTLDSSSPRDYIDCFLNRMQQEKHNVSSEFFYDNLVATVMNLFLAGTETSSSTIRYALSVFIKYPDIQEKMQQEIDAVIGRERCPKMEDRKSMPFTDAVIHEVQRFLDIVPFSLPHYTLHDVSFRGYNIPKDTIIIPMLHSVLKDEKQWAEPQSFNPQHFLDHNGNFKKNPAFMPFAAGKRACVGESLARVELFIFLVSLLQHFTFSCVGGPDSIDLTPEYSSFANMPRQHQLIATPR